jgi:hypothetical protein
MIEYVLACEPASSAVIVCVPLALVRQAVEGPDS